MTYWKVHPAAVRGVLAKVEQERDGFEDTERCVSLATGAAIAAAPGTRTAAALTTLATDPFGLDIRATSSQVHSMVEATRAALADYEAGDAQMAEQVDRAARGAR